MHMEYMTPAGEYSTLYANMLAQTHLLIAGATGSGKNTVVNGIIHAALFNSPAKVQFVLIDPKGTELLDYKTLPHTIAYALEIPDCVNALKSALQLVKNRFQAMQKKHMRVYDGSDVYIIIDELMFLLNRPQYKRVAMDLLQDILVIARAARVHVIACTQSPTEKTGLPVNLRCNFDSRLALRTSTAQDSRNIIGVKGCELFPNPPIDHIAYGYYMHGGTMELYELTRIPDTEIARIVKHWKRNKGHIKLF